jgi:hypothetical protein
VADKLGSVTDLKYKKKECASGIFGGRFINIGDRFSRLQATRAVHRRPILAHRLPISSLSIKLPNIHPFTHNFHK